MDEYVKESFPPIIDENSRVLLLGSLPGDRSLEKHEYYAHGRNVFWPMMATLLRFECDTPYEKRLGYLQDHGIALWDVVARASRVGSMDSRIKQAVPNDIEGLLTKYPLITGIGCNGTASYRFLKRFFPTLWTIETLEIVQLPSTSPAAAMWTREQKKTQYAEFLKRHISLSA